MSIYKHLLKGRDTHITKLCLAQIKQSSLYLYKGQKKILVKTRIKFFINYKIISYKQHLANLKGFELGRFLLFHT